MCLKIKFNTSELFSIESVFLTRSKNPTIQGKTGFCNTRAKPVSLVESLTASPFSKKAAYPMIVTLAKPKHIHLQMNKSPRLDATPPNGTWTKLMWRVMTKEKMVERAAPSLVSVGCTS